MDWELHDGEKQHGPFTEEAVIDAIRRGLEPTTQLRPVGRDKWKTLRAHAPFAAALDSRTEARAASGSNGEVTFMQSVDVLITNKRAVLKGTTYPLANITSVRAHRQPPSKALAVLGLAAVLLGAGLAWATNFTSSAANWLMLCGFALELFHFAVMRPTHWVRVATAGGETNAVGYAKASQAQRVVQALSDAIVSRSA